MSLPYRSAAHAALLCFVALGACSAPDPQAIEFAEGRVDRGGGGGGGGDDEPSGGGGGGDGGGAAPSDGFFEGAYDPAKPAQPTETATQAHAGAASAPTPPTDRTKDCISCHKTGGAAAGAIFVFGGTVTKKDKITPMPNAEIRVLNADKTVVGSAKSGMDGNFWLKMGDAKAALAGGAEVRVRTPAGEKKMSDKIADGSCNSAVCHGGGTAVVFTDD